MKLRLMASGINIENKPDNVVLGLAKAQLDFQMIEYYKLLVSTHVSSGNIEAANEALSRLFALINMEDTSGSTMSKQERMMKDVADIENMEVSIVKGSLPLAQHRLIERKHKP